MTDTIVERVARVLCALAADIDLTSPRLSDGMKAWVDDHWRGYEKFARSAIAALREPTEAMIQEGYCEAGGTDVDPAKVWRFMIDAALAQSE